MLKPWIDATLSTYHVDGLVKRARHEVRRRLGVYERLKSSPAPATRLLLPTIDLEPLRDFFRNYPDQAGLALDAADDVLSGKLRFFGGDLHEVGFPPNWYRHPLTNHASPQTHWSRLSDDGQRGDVKWLWEAGRFSFALTLGRAYAASGQARYRDAFSAALADFIDKNPPYAGVHWSCGQEAAHRVIAVVLASSVFGVPTRAGTQRLVQFIHDSGRRIAASLDYALSQRNNHGLSELTGLFLCAQVCPDLPAAGRWQNLVRARLPRLLADQFAGDGSYIQESLAYHRFALELLLVLSYCQRAFRQPPLPGVSDALRRGTRYLLAFACPTSGCLPNLGANDGSRVLPLASLPHGDVRPTLTHAMAALGIFNPFGRGAWDEQAVWFGYPPTQPPPSEGRRKEVARVEVFPSGNVCSRRGESRLILRAPEHRHHRPSHADSLHVDVWHAGSNLALDPGTYLYSGAPPWDNSLSETRVHNTVSVGTGSQMTRRGRFFWTHWNQARLALVHDLPGGTLLLCETHADAARRYLHRRLLIHTSDGAIILDEVSGPDLSPLRVHWNLCSDFVRTRPGVYARGGVRFSCEARPHGRSLDLVADAASNLGWHAPTYGQKQPCRAIELEVTALRANFMATFDFSSNPAWPELCARLWARVSDGDILGARDEAQRALS